MRLLVTGAGGRLGRYILREARLRDYEVIAWSGRQTGEVSGYRLISVPLEKPDVLRKRFHEAKPDMVLHAAALAKVEDCRQNPWLADQVNAIAPCTLAELATSRCRLVHVSTDMVFRGDRAPYRESDPRSPLSEYGRSKLRAENELAKSPGACIARTSLLFGSSLGDPLSFFDQLLQTIRDGRRFAMYTDEFRTPLSLPAAARGLLDLAASEQTGVWNLGGPERLSRYEFGQRLANYLGLSRELIRPMSRLESPAIEPRPADLSLDSSKFRNAFPRWRTPALEESFEEMEVRR
jgi:dTDP-4-dehydrorhamnose reductase